MEDRCPRISLPAKSRKRFTACKPHYLKSYKNEHLGNIAKKFKRIYMRLTGLFVLRGGGYVNPPIFNIQAFVYNKGVQRTTTYFESALRLLSKQYMDSKSKNKYDILSFLGVLKHPKLVMFAKSIHIDAPKLSFFLAALMWILFRKAVLTSIWNYYEHILLLHYVLEYGLLATLRSG